MARKEDTVLNESAYSSSSSVVQYVCDRAKCKGTSWYADRIVRRYRSISLGKSTCEESRPMVQPGIDMNTGRLCKK